ncbi:MAG: DUF4976 domain-containing protein, partial [Planctomycetes bacterium]|nr:DUF4976 domain-containing protein [Planctomycetota bacterium]
KTCSQPVSLLDIYPTLNELCGIHTSETLDGTSLVPLLKNPGKKIDRAVVTTQGFQNHAVRSDRWRYIRYADGSEELYDQQLDPKNFHNLAGRKKYNAIIQDMAKWLPKHNAERDPTANAQKEMNEESKATKNPKS